MNTTTINKRYYSPQFSAMAAVSVRRLAWALGVSMAKAVDQIVTLLPSLFSPSVICPQCKDRTKCKLCGFNQQASVENTGLGAI
jgi:primosomal protein N'